MWARFVGIAVQSLLCVSSFVLAGFYMAWLPIQCIRYRRERKQAQKQVLEIIAAMERKHLITRKIPRKPGKYHLRNWAHKWVIYSRNIPVARQRYQMSGREMPPFPRSDE